MIVGVASLYYYFFKKLLLCYVFLPFENVFVYLVCCFYLRALIMFY